MVIESFTIFIFEYYEITVLQIKSLNSVIETSDVSGREVVSISMLFHNNKSILFIYLFHKFQLKHYSVNKNNPPFHYKSIYNSIHSINFPDKSRK